ncbi:hypothetical protein BDV96DRAFT_634067 [Lophiotrema nucula]|uniref:Uncharacterized protein n=1 Tax=Lophiotrema nucula TaxID=690887 RepID=A0A6A5Z1X2_9PLEO|nr:hypothetical protein BDV96DRAFT_634067 [Lophiotrema nucula]
MQPTDLDHKFEEKKVSAGHEQLSAYMLDESAFSSKGSSSRRVASGQQQHDNNSQAESPSTCNFIVDAFFHECLSTTTSSLKTSILTDAAGMELYSSTSAGMVENEQHSSSRINSGVHEANETKSRMVSAAGEAAARSGSGQRGMTSLGSMIKCSKKKEEREAGRREYYIHYRSYLISSGVCRSPSSTYTSNKMVSFVTAMHEDQLHTQLGARNDGNVQIPLAPRGSPVLAGRAMDQLVDLEAGLAEAFRSMLSRVGLNPKFGGIQKMIRHEMKLNLAGASGWSVLALLSGRRCAGLAIYLIALPDGLGSFLFDRVEFLDIGGS